MREQISRFMQEWPAAKSQVFADNRYGTFVRSEIPKVLYETKLVDRVKYKIQGSVGQGNWATIPWIAIFDKSITISAQKGIYIVYLLSSDSKRLYLSFNQGCTELKNTRGRKDTIAILEKTADEIRRKVDGRGFSIEQNMNLEDRPTGNGIFYEKGDIYHTVYETDAIPSDAVLLNDLSRMMSIYKDYVASQEASSPTDNPSSETEAKGDEADMEVKEQLEQIKSYIAAKGFTYDNGLIENFYLSLKTKPFVILAGTSGTGKTRLVRLFAEAIGASFEAVPVRPDWSDSTDLFGHVDLNGHFVPGKILDFLWAATQSPERPFILCLDEMNLARVEYYLSDFLSVIETREMKEGRIESFPLITEGEYGTDQGAREKYGNICFPENLYIVGTVNMDETTFPFSRKVLDRANTIEFNYVNLIPAWSDGGEKAEKLNAGNAFLRSQFLLLKECPESERDYISGVCAEMEKMNQILQKANAHVGYRVRDEIIFYLLNNKAAGLIDEDAAMDNEILQKILPRIQGSSVSVKDMLCDLFKAIVGDYEGYQTESNNTAERMLDKIRKKGQVKYPKSSEKIAFMVRRFEEDGFTSYWL